MRAQTLALPVPGPVWGDYPLRPPDKHAPARQGWRLASGLPGARRLAPDAARHGAQWRGLAAQQRAHALQDLRRRLRREGLRPAVVAQALGLAAAVAGEVLGLVPRATQILAAAVLLDHRMAEMATGEGKTLVIGLAAAVAALAGMPVHVATANAYLARRDADTLAPLFDALGLRVAALPGADGEAARRAVYAHDVVYATAKDLAFDFLRDRQALAGSSVAGRAAAALSGRTLPQPVMRGLCMVLLDEADSILLDEADMPLILSQAVPQAARRAFLWQALALARQLGQHRDYALHAADRVARLTPAGELRLQSLVDGLGGPWSRPRYRREAVVMALAGLHLYHRDQHYLVRDGAIELLDAVTGRAAPGRVWSRGLHTVIALKEGLSPPPETETVAQTTYQRFFQRYWRLSGISGTLCEARSELQSVYGVPVVRIPLHRPSRRIDLPDRRFPSAHAMHEAVAERVAALQASGRPVLVGTDTVADSERVSACLQACGIGHRVLNALRDAEEAAIVAEAGHAGSVTVATRMAGRGTDIELDEAARAAGGLHVLSCQQNDARRLDRQLAGRAARHGDPGSVEWWTFPGAQPHWAGMGGLFRRWYQWREEQRRAALRQNLLEQDQRWERRLAFAGAAD